MPEDPPGDGDHPQDDHHYHHHIIDQITSKLTEAAGDIITHLLVILDAAHDFIEDNPDHEQDGDAHPTCHQEPGHVWLCWAVGIFLSRRGSFYGSNHYHEE